MYFEFDIKTHSLEGTESRSSLPDGRIAEDPYETGAARKGHGISATMSGVFNRGSSAGHFIGDF